MIRQLTAAVAALLVCCASGVPTTSDSAVAIVSRNNRAVCSAFAVDEHELFTEAHCLNGNKVSIISRESWNATARGATPAEVVSIDDARDIAVLRVPVTFRHFFSIRPPRTGEPVFTIAAVYDWSKSSGEVLRGEGWFRDSTLTIKHGWSGSPVIGNDGKAVGIVHSCRGMTVDNVHRCREENAAFSVLQ